VSVKLNPPMLGRARLEHLLHEQMGYKDIEVNPKAYTAGLELDEAVELCRRLAGFAAARGRHFGVKFCNTLEVRNRRKFFPPSCEVMYLSGQPLYVLAMALADTLRRVLGPDIPFSYSGGIDKLNFPDAVACGFVPVTVCTDLLKPGGYGRLPAYLQRLADEMRQVGAADIAGFIRARGGGAPDAVAETSRRNLTEAAERARADERYCAARVYREPNRAGSSLGILDCITCDKCIPVCPNAAIFTYPTVPVAVTYHNIIVDPSGQWQTTGEQSRLVIEHDRQIAFFADFCNECGNCGTFCPERGAPYQDKPGFFGSLDSWRRAAPRDGYLAETGPWGCRIHGRIAGRTYVLEASNEAEHSFRDGPVEVVMDAQYDRIRQVRLLEALMEPYRVDLGVCHTLARLLAGVLDPQCVNQINVRGLR